MKVKSTKSALLMSFTSLLLCFAMLIGTTFAWFTDSVTSGVNKIVAGNLDVEVEYSKDGSNWADLQNSDSLFTGALWEPGHTEVVYLRVKNAGTLALKYDLKVSPVSESGGINQEGNSFKLSDYIKFATVSADTLTTYTRETARTAVGEGVALNSGLLQSGELQPKAASAADLPTKYVTLVVYMPENVGNVANYKTGTTAPYIDLGITVLATQVEKESDSFDENYDAGLTNDATVIYNYFPQVSQSAQLVKANNVAAKGDKDPQVNETTDGKITINSVAKVDQSVASSEPVASVTFANTAVNFGANNAATVTLNVKKVNAPTANITVTDTQEKVAFDVNVTITGADFAKTGDNFTSPMEVTMFIGKGKTNLKLYHSTTLMKTTTDTDYVAGAADTFTYNPNTGVVTMYVNHFSEFTAVYDEPVAAIGTTAYYSLATAVAAAETGETVTLLKSCSGAGVFAPKTLGTLTVDLAGNTYTCTGPAVGSKGTESQAFHLENATTVLKNGTVVSTQNSGVKMLVQNYSNLTLENVTLDGRNLDDSNIMYYTLSNNKAGITTTIKAGTTIYAHADKENATGKAFDADKGAAVVVEGGNIYGIMECSASSTISITGGTFSKDPSAFVKTGYEAVASGNVWTIKKVCAAQIGDTKYVTLEEALNAAKDDDTVTLLADVSKTNANGNVFTISKSITLDGNNKKITITGNSASRGILLESSDGDKTATIKDLTIETTGVEKTIGFNKGSNTFGGTLDNVTVIAQGVGVHTKGYADVEIKNCTINITTEPGKYTAHNRSGVSAGPGQTTTISNTNVTVTAKDRVDNDKKTWGKAIYVGRNDVENGGKVVINSGEIKGDFALAIDGTKADYTGKPTTSTNTIIANGGHYTGAIGSPSGYSWKELYLKGGTFDELAVAAHGFGTSKEDTSYLEITGGTFSVKPAAEYIPTGYAATESSGVWTVKATN